MVLFPSSWTRCPHFHFSLGSTQYVPGPDFKYTPYHKIGPLALINPLLVNDLWLIMLKKKKKMVVSSPDLSYLIAGHVLLPETMEEEENKIPFFF